MGRLGDEWTVVSTDRCFFFGCGSTGLLDRCFDRTGTAVLVQVVTRGVSGSGGRGTGADGGQESDIGL